MSLYSSVCSLIFIISVRRYQHRSHHCQRTKSRGNHITHNISVIVLAGPDKSPFCLHNTGNDIIDQAVEIFNSGSLKFLFEFLLINLCKNLLKASVINLGDRILASKPQTLLCIQRIIKATLCKTCDGCIQVMHSLKDTCTFIMMDQFLFLLTVLTLKQQIGISRSVNIHFCILIYISISVTGNGNGFLPVLYAWLDSLYYNRGTEHGSIQNGTDGTIRTFVHFFQCVLFHSGFIGSDGCTFYSNAIFLCSFCCIYSYLIICFISVFQAKIIVLCVQINKRKKKLILDHLPEDSGHLVSVHLYKRCLHLNFFHKDPPLCMGFIPLAFAVTVQRHYTEALQFTYHFSGNIFVRQCLFYIQFS